MDEMSIRQQIKQIEDVMQYILLICDEADKMEQSVADSVTYLRQNGLRTETADMIQQVYLGYIHQKLTSMLSRMKSADYKFLEEIKNDLERILMR